MRARVLFLGKADDPYTERALDFCLQAFTDVTACLGRWGDPLPAPMCTWEGEYILSFLSRWVVPEWVLLRAGRASLNFHPAPPEYPGVGCVNFALYEGAEEYGVTCHHMVAQVDSGPIVAVRRFPIYAWDTVASLLTRTYAYLEVLFYEVMDRLLAGDELPLAPERWRRPAFTRRDLDMLSRIEPGMTEEEVQRRVRATTFGPWRPFVLLHGHRFCLEA